MKQYSGIDEDIFLRFLELAYIEQLTREYSKMGYETFTEFDLGERHVADFVARKGTELVVYEIKTAQKGNQKKILAIRNYAAHYPGKVKFRVTFLERPSYKDIAVDDIEDKILEDMTKDGIPSKIDVMSTHSTIESISDVEVESIHIENDEIRVVGNGSVDVGIQYGSDSDNRDDDSEFGTSVPFSFEIVLDKDGNIDGSSYVFDTDEYFE